MIAITRELVKSALIESIESRAIQQRQHRRDILIHKRQHRRQVRDYTRQCDRDALLRSLKEEAAEIVSLEESLSIVYPARNVSGIHAGEGVDRAGVSAELHDLGILCGEDCNVRLVECQMEDCVGWRWRLTTAGTAP